MENIKGKLNAVDDILAKLSEEYENHLRWSEESQTELDEYIKENPEDAQDAWRIESYKNNRDEYKNKAEAYKSMYDILRKNIDKII